MTKCIENHLTGISKYQKQKQIVLYFHTIIPTTMKPVDDRKKMSIYKKVFSYIAKKNNKTVNS